MNVVWVTNYSFKRIKEKFDVLFPRDEAKI